MVRKPVYLQSARDGRERWLISYTDILTLLLILFVAMAAETVGQSQARAVETKPLAASSAAPMTPLQATPVTEAPQTPASSAPETAVSQTPEPPAPSAAVPQNASHAALIRAQERLKQRGLDLHLEARGLVISLPQAILFASGDDRINRSAVPILSEIADSLRELDNKVELVGHADSIPIHTQRFRNNWELSAARGLSLLNALVTEYGIAESRLTVSSHGSYSPKSSNDTADGRAGNRRVEILILDEPQQ